MLHLLLAFAQQINKINFRLRCQNRQRRRRRRRRLRCVSFMRLAFVAKSAVPWSRPGLGLKPGTTGDANNYISISRCGFFYCTASKFYGAQVYDIALTAVCRRIRRYPLATLRSPLSALHSLLVARR